MWSTSTILDIRDSATHRARRAHLKPTKAQDFLDGKSIPFLGDYVPEGWVRDPNIELFQVWNNAESKADGLTWSLDQLRKQARNFALARPDVYAYGVIEQGPFQVVVAVYRPDPRDYTHTGNLTESELKKARPS